MSKSNLKIKPLHDRVVVRREEEEPKSAGGILIPDSAKEKPAFGVVLACGEGKLLDNGEIRPLAVKKGNKIVFGKYAGTEVKIGNQELVVMREDDIIGIIED